MDFRIHDAGVVENGTRSFEASCENVVLNELIEHANLALPRFRGHLLGNCQETQMKAALDV